MRLYSKYEVVVQEFRNWLFTAKKNPLNMRDDGKYVVHP
jgi:hypothetical protein